MKGGSIPLAGATFFAGNRPLIAHMVQIIQLSLLLAIIVTYLFFVFLRMSSKNGSKSILNHWQYSIPNLEVVLSPHCQNA